MFICKKKINSQQNTIYFFIFMLILFYAYSFLCLFFFMLILFLRLHDYSLYFISHLHIYTFHIFSLCHNTRSNIHRNQFLKHQFTRIR